ncbi:MAG TPA: alpha/beta hydrolase, partial [Nocardioidaceae bacterium]|nr:alpha/beta hydrolase [Nocardioidaceae bacterium]
MPTTRTRAARRRLAAVALPVVLGVTLSGCLLTSQEEPETLPSPTLSAKPVPTPTESPSKAADSGLQRYYSQKVDWRGCRQSMQCAKIRVPLDYARPDGRSIMLSLIKLPAANPRQRVGSLVVNPGGPGGSGIEYAANAGTYFGPELRQAFDIVGFDPRGVGESTPVDCMPDAKLDEFVASDPDPDTSAEVAKSDELAREFGQGCVENS